MRYCSYIFMVCVLLFGLVSSRREELRYVEDCSNGCLCQDINCVRDKNEVYCRETQVVCEGANVTTRLETLPINTTRLSVTGENMGHINLDMFADLSLLLKLALRNNVIRSLKITKSIRFLNYLNLDGNRLCFFPTRNLTHLPSLRMLKARWNNLTFMHDIQFPLRLVDLDLSHNHIESPRKGSFRRLRRLEFLRLANNSITKIFPLAFRHLIKLQTLILDHNKISVLGPDAFRLLPSVSLISLKHNRIHQIDPFAFKQMGVKWHKMHEIRLEYNDIGILEKNSIKILFPRSTIYSLYLANNPLFCDCEMVSIMDEAENLIRDSDRATCASPRELAGIPLKKLDFLECEEDDFYYDYD